ncbi:S2-RNase [Pyrus ussuriensis x Pyrus communis]|uniref:S2-RNase n=1 Tax=Pyrus ussuriensis x Pyrus communis TaxID=2448454 RepID=A0A5N5HYA1_9ROSA|nr:S2-RNase [Pyrus ussuriensis x Pyrus communis]
MEWGMVGVAAMEERMLENWKGMHGKGICVVERMDGRTCEWQLGMIKEGNAWWPRHGCVCVHVADLFVG